MIVIGTEFESLWHCLRGITSFDEGITVLPNYKMSYIH